MTDRSQFLTERRLPESVGLDAMDSVAIVALMNAQDRLAVEAVARAAGDVAAAADLIAERLGRGGRLIYAGAGSSGRLGVLDASECPPTFRSDPEQVIGIIAGGDEAMFRAREGAEDSTGDGAGQIAARDVTEADVVCGIAAGGTTPFVHGALAEAKRRGAATLFVTCVEAFPNEPRYDVTIRALVGPEVLTGSTRLKAGTATKLILNQLTTTAFVRLGKCYDNWMVDLKATNAKLQDRAARIVAEVCRMPRDEAADVLREADGHVKVAIVMQSRGCDAAAARKTLAACGGRLREAIGG
ncbi:MAG TPA: N-acetylmuramic acid 6-phosphate etherase [Tepidisphaeraceae bacterium]